MAVLPAAVVPVPAVVRDAGRHGDDVAHALGDVLLAAGAEVGLGRLVRLDPPDLDLVIFEGPHQPKKAQPNSSRHATMAPMTMA